MRQEIIYSLLAVAAVPVTVNAADVTVPTGVATDSWDGTEMKSGLVQIASGTVTCNLGTLVPGRYQLKLNTTAEVTVTVKGQSATSSSNLTLPFEVTETEEVSFTVVATAAATLSNISLNLTADFLAISQALLNHYSTTMNTIGGYGYVTGNSDTQEIIQLGDIKTIIDNIKVASGASAYEDIWKKYQLWLYPDNTADIPVYKDITAIKEAADLKEIAYQAAKLEAAIQEAKETFEANDNSAVPSYVKEALTEEFNALVDKVDAYKKGTTVEGYADIATEITAFKAKVKNDGTNNTSYTTIITAITTATTNYTTQYNTLKNTILAERIVEAIGTENRNATLWSEAEEEMKKQFDAIGAVKQQADALFQEGTSNTWAATTNDKKGYQNLLDAIATEITNIVTNYTNYADRLKYADVLYAAQAKKVSETLEENAVAIQKKVDGVAEAVEAANTALANLLAYINKHLSKENLGADLVSNDEITDAEGKKYVEPITTALETLKAKAQKVTENEGAYNMMVKEIDELIADFDKYLAGIEAYGDFDPVNVNYAAEIARIKGLGTELKALAKEKHDDANLLATAFSTGETAEDYPAKKTELSTAIKTFTDKDLANEVTIYKADMEALSKAQAAYDALLAKIKGLFIYTSTDEGTTYSHAWMKKQQESIDSEKSNITDYLKKTEFSELTGMPNLVETINTITAALNTVNNDETIQNANNTYQTVQETQALKTTYDVAKSQWTAMKNRLDAITDDTDKYGLLSNTIIQNKKTAVTTIFNEITNPNTTNGLSIDQLTEILSQISDLNPALKEVEDYAAAIAARVQANKDALTTFATKADALVQNYKTTLDAAVSADAATQSIADPSNYAWNGLFTDVWNDIKELFANTPEAPTNYTKITTIDDVKNATVKAAYEREELQESDYAGILKDLNDRIAAAKANADLSLKNYAAYLEVDNLLNKTTVTPAFTCITDRISTAKTAAQTADKNGNDDGAAWTNYYSKLWDDGDAETETGFEEILAKYMAELTAARAAFNFNGTDTDQFPFAIKDNLKKKATDLATSAEAVKAQVTANKTAYNARNTAATTAEDTYKEVALEVNALDETTLTKEWKDTLADLYNQLLAIKEAIEEDYKNGRSDDNGALTQSIVDITTAMKTIKGKIAGEYDPSVQADNEEKLQNIRNAVNAAKDTFKKANAYMDQFRNLSSETFAAAIQAAATASVDLNNALTTFPSAIATAEANAQAHFDAVNATPKVYKEYDDDLATIKGLEGGIKTAQAKYKDAIDTKVSTVVGNTITDYRTALNDAKTAVNNFTLTGDAIKEADRDVFFKTVEDFVTALEDAQDNTKITELDQMLKEAADETTGVAAMIATAKNETAASVLGKLLGELEAKVIADNDYASTLDEAKQTTYQAQLETLKGYRTEYDELYKNKTLSYKDNKVDNFTTLRDKYIAWQKANVVTIAQAADTTYDKLQALIAERLESLAAATAYIENYAAAGNMKKTTLANIASAIQIIKDNVETNKDNYAILSGYIDAKKTPEDAENNDYTQLQQVDADIETAKTIDLRAAEANYLSSAINDLTSDYYDLEKTDAEAAAPFKEQILGNGKEGDEEVKSLKDRLKAIVDDNTKTVDDLKQFETVIAELMDQLNTAAQGDSQAIKDQLTEKLNAVSAKATLESYDEAVQTAFDSDLQALKQKISALADAIAKSTSPAFDKENIELTIGQLDSEVTALLSKAAAAQKEIDDNKTAAEKLTADLTELEEAIAELETTLNDTEQFQKVSSTTFRAKLNQLASEIANQKALVAEAAANMEAGDNTLTTSIATFVTNTNNAIDDVKNSAARREIVAYADAFTEEVAAITYKPGNYTDGDLETIETSLTNIKKAIGAPQSVDEEGNDVAASGLYLTANGSKITEPAKDPITYAGLAAAKTTIEGIAEQIEEVKAKIANVLEPEPEIIPGDLTGKGEVKDEDVDKFLADFSSGNVPEPGDEAFVRYDANGDGVINVADLVAIYNLSQGLDIHGKDPDWNGARQKVSEVADKGSVNVEATNMGNGITRVALQLNTTQEFIVFQTDVMLSNGMKIVGEQLGEAAQGLTLTSNDLTDTKHRVLGYALDGSSISNGTVLYIDVEGDGSIVFDNIAFGTRSAKSYTFDTSSTTGISNINADSNNETVYDLRGKVVNGLKKGVNIIRNAYGNVKKRIIK